MNEIERIRELPASRPRPVGSPARRQRLDEVGSSWPIAPDVALQAVDLAQAGAFVYRHV